MNTKFTAAAQAIADHFKQAEARRGDQFPETFIDPMCNDAVRANTVGIPVALLRALVEAETPQASPTVTPQMIEAGVNAARECMERTGGNDPAVIFHAMYAAQEATASSVAEPMHVALKAAFLVGLAALIDRMDEDVDSPAKARWKAWVQKEVDSIPDEMTGDYAIDCAIKFFNEADPVLLSSDDLKKVSNPDAGAVLQPAPAFDPYSGR